jgi:hypothetical protein
LRVARTGCALRAAAARRAAHHSTTHGKMPPPQRACPVRSIASGFFAHISLVIDGLIRCDDDGAAADALAHIAYTVLKNAHYDERVAIFGQNTEQLSPAVGHR